MGSRVGVASNLFIIYYYYYYLPAVKRRIKALGMRFTAVEKADEARTIFKVCCSRRVTALVAVLLCNFN
jgi:hypothetical protein